MSDAIKKNDEFVVNIEDISHEGLGIAHLGPDRFALFVKDALPGDRVRVGISKLKKSYAYARTIEILEASPDRIEPPCPLARSCGGCQLQHMRYEAQLSFKERMVRETIRRIGGIEDPLMLPIMGMDSPWHYRNKAQFPVGRDRDGRVVMGFYAGRTHRIIDIGQAESVLSLQTELNRDCSDIFPRSGGCLLQDEAGMKLISICRQWMEDNHISPYDEERGEGLVRHIMTRAGKKTGELMLCLVINGKKLPHAESLISELKDVEGLKSACISSNMKKTNVIMGDGFECIFGQDHICDYIGDVKYRISPLSFFQINPAQTEKLYGVVRDFAAPGKDEVVWDLYCGIGSIALYLAKSAGEVYGIEIVPQAIEDAKGNARMNGIENAFFYTGRAEDIAPISSEKAGEEGTIYMPDPDIVVVDPPRKGCDRKLLEFICSKKPSRIVYVSCNPATLARDVKILCEGGYKLSKMQCCDLFSHTVHCEVVSLLELI